MSEAFEMTQIQEGKQVSANVCVGYLWFGNTEGQYRPTSLSISYGALVPASVQEDESSDRIWGLGEAAESALLELEPVATAPRPTFTHITDNWPVNQNGTLSGPMAGKRPPAGPVAAI